MDYDLQYVIIGDLNTRFGSKVHDLVADSGKLSYSPIDLGENNNGKAVIQVCKDQKLLVVNNLSTEHNSFKGNFTYKKGKRWVSEVDVCLVSRSMVSNIEHFFVDHTSSLPSDHAPVTITLRILN